MQPSFDVVTGRATAMNDLMMAAPAAEISRPAASAWFLAMHVPLGQPPCLTLAVDARINIAHCSCFVFYKAMAGVQTAFGRDAEISSARAAGIRTVGAFMYLAHGIHHVEKCIALTANDSALELAATANHLLKHQAQVRRVHLPPPGRRGKHGREADTVESHGQKLIQGLKEKDILWRNCDSRGNLHTALCSQQGPDIGEHPVVAALPALEWPQLIMGRPNTIKTDGYRETVALEEFAIFRSDQGSVGGDGESDLRALRCGFVTCSFHTLLQESAVDKRLATKKGDMHGFSASSIGKKHFDGPHGGMGIHVFLSSAEAAFLGITVSTAEVAFLRDGQGERAHGWIDEWLVGDVVRRCQTEFSQQLLSVYGRFKFSRDFLRKAKDTRSVDQQCMLSKFRFEEMKRWRLW